MQRYSRIMHRQLHNMLRNASMDSLLQGQWPETVGS